MRRPQLLPAFLSAALLVAACSSSGDDDGTSAAAGGDDTEAVSEQTEEIDAGDPVPVTMQLEAATASTTAVGSEGANIGATAADGTEYTLRIPPGALAETVDIVMTPLVGLTGLPDGDKLAFGVSLEPSGLVFGRPSWLFVSSGLDPDEVTGLSIHDDEATLAGIGFDGERFVLPITHFSGGAACYPRCGGGGGWPGFPDSPGGPGQPGGPGGPGGPPTNPGPQVPPYEPPGTPPRPFPGDDAGSSGGSNPTGHGSLTDGATGGTQSGTSGGTDAAVADALGDLADAQLTGDEEAEARANEKLDKVKEKVKDEAWNAAKACVEEKDITKLKDVLHWLTIGQLLGAAKDDAEEERLTSLIGVCFNFELDVLADMTMKLGGETFVIGDSIEMTIPMAFNGGGAEGTATGPVDPTGYDRGAEFLELFGMGMGAAMGLDIPNDISRNDYFECSTKPGTGTLHALATNFFADTGPAVNIAPSIASSAVVNCQEPFTNMEIPPFVVDLEGYPETGFPGVHDAGILFQDWTVTGGGTPFATKSVHHTISEEGAELLMAWDLTLRHAPKPLPERPEGWPNDGSRSTSTSRPSLSGG